MKIFENPDEYEILTYQNYYEFVGNVLNQIMNDVSVPEFFNIFFVIKNNNIETTNRPFILNLFTNIKQENNTIYNDKQENAFMSFDTIAMFFKQLIQQQFDSNGHLKKNILLYFNLFNKLASTSYGYTALQHYNILDNFLNFYNNKKENDEKRFFLKLIIKYSNSTIGLYNLISKGKYIKNDIMRYLDDTHSNVNKTIDLFNGMVCTGLMKNFYSLKIINSLVCNIHQRIFSTNDILFIMILYKL